MHEGHAPARSVEEIQREIARLKAAAPGFSPFGSWIASNLIHALQWVIGDAELLRPSEQIDGKEKGPPVA